MTSASSALQRNNYKWRETMYSLRGLWFSGNEKNVTGLREVHALQIFD